MQIEGAEWKGLYMEGREPTEFRGTLGLDWILLEADGDEDIVFGGHCVGQASVVAVDKHLLVRRGSQGGVGKEGQERN